MTELIPHLKDLREASGFRVPETFVKSYLQLHRNDWRAAQSHWEAVVGRVLDTDAVDQAANGIRAIRQAVTAAYVVLEAMATRDRCPLCPRREDLR
jgi:hypothetical protein